MWKEGEMLAVVIEPMELLVIAMIALFVFVLPLAVLGGIVIVLVKKRKKIMSSQDESGPSETESGDE